MSGYSGLNSDWVKGEDRRSRAGHPVHVKRDCEDGRFAPRDKPEGSSRSACIRTRTPGTTTAYSGRRRRPRSPKDERGPVGPLDADQANDGVRAVDVADAARGVLANPYPGVLRRASPRIAPPRRTT